MLLTRGNSGRVKPVFRHFFVCFRCINGKKMGCHPLKWKFLTYRHIWPIFGRNGVLKATSGRAPPENGCFWKIFVIFYHFWHSSRKVQNWAYHTWKKVILDIFFDIFVRFQQIWCDVCLFWMIVSSHNGTLRSWKFDVSSDFRIKFRLSFEIAGSRRIFFFIVSFFV